MEFIKNLARLFYRLLPESALKRVLTGYFYRMHYRGYLKDYRFTGGVFTLTTNEGMEIKSVKDFDPEPLIQDFSSYPVYPGSVVVDLGGNLGVVTVYLSKKTGPTGKVIVYEPDQGNFEKLTKNLEINGVSNVIAVPKGVWKDEGTLEFYAGGNYTSSFVKTGFVARESKKYAVVSIPVVSLDREFERLGLEKIDLMKIDIEGSEVEALEGARSCLKHYHPRLVIEIHTVNGVSTRDRIIRLLHDMGYQKIQVKGEGDFPTVFAE